MKLRDEFVEAFWEGFREGIRLHVAVLTAIPRAIKSYLNRTGEWEKAGSVTGSNAGRQLGRVPWRR